MSALVPRPVLRAHVPDPAVPWAHPVGTVGQPHEHVIHEEHTVEMKNNLAAHIASWHRSGEGDEPPRDYSGDRG